jgi:protein gp37
MGETTGIGWTHSTWNVWTGCTKVSRGCDHCYIVRTPPFFYNGRSFDGDGPGSATGLVFHPERLAMPFRTGKRALGPRVFVNSLSDVFHEDAPVELVADMFAVMAATPWLTYQVLTKRPGPMRSKLRSRTFWDLVFASDAPHKYGNGREDIMAWNLAAEAGVAQNVHLLVSVEDQPAADLRIPILLDTPGAVLGISAEPLVGPLRLGDWLLSTLPGADAAAGLPSISPLHGVPRLDWVIAGGESGPGHEPMDVQWAADLYEQCRDAGVPFYMKQASGPRSGMQGDIPDDLWSVKEFPTDVQVPA